VTQDVFESRILHLWMTTRVPLTRANVLFFTHAPRRKADRWLEALVKEGVLDFDSDEEGEVVWTVRGAARPDRGPEKVEDVLRLEELRGEVRRRPPAVTALRPARRAPGERGLVEQAVAREGGEKSLLASGILSLVLGPIGWLYAGPLREALPATLVFALTLWVLRLLPFLLSGPAVSLLYVASGAMGVLYAWQYNKSGHTTPLLSGDDRPRLPGRR
jgi:hypothetical protein